MQLQELNMSDKTVLVTGISGFIAKHCALDLLQHGYRVRGTVRSLKKADEVKATLSKHCDVSSLEFIEADLLSDTGWDAAMQGIYGVQHVASPFILNEPKDPNELIRPAVDGTVRVLKAAVGANVQRLVQTSSVAAIMYGHPKTRTAPFTEEDWTQLDSPGLSAYIQSKTLSERAARDFMAQRKPAMHYASVNPGFVLGPLLDRDMGSSAEVIQMFLRGKYPGCPKLSFSVVDVRDIAKMHRLAMETTEPSGGRYMGASGSAWFVDMMRPIKARLGAKAKKVPTFELPNFMLHVVALFDPAARTILPDLGEEVRIDNSRTRKALGMDFIGVEESAPAMAQSLVDLGLA
jgi:dihydroflavonol-4-reductase